MPPCLHTAKITASSNVCCQHEDWMTVPALNASMSFIKFWREKRGMTLQAVGEALEPPASAGTIHSYESGARDTSLKRLVNLAQVLGVSPGQLLDGPTRLPTQAEVAEMLAVAQSELPIGVSYADYPTAVASSLHAQLLRYAGRSANAHVGSRAPSTSPDEVAPPRPPTKKSAQG